MMLEEEDIQKAVQEKKQIGYKKVCVCKPNCGKMECFTRQLYDMYYIK